VSDHLIHIETVHAEHLLDLPRGVFIVDADVVDSKLVLGVASASDLGSTELLASYGNIEEESSQLFLGQLVPKEG
jgi:hypothetical protein